MTLSRTLSGQGAKHAPARAGTNVDLAQARDTAAPAPDVLSSALVPCQPVEEWLYGRGPGNLMATVRFRSGAVRSISYGRVPR